MSGFLFSTAGLRDSRRFSTYSDFDPLGGRPERPQNPNRRSTTRPSWVRFPSDIHLTALPDLSTPAPSKVRASHNSHTRRPGSQDTQNATPWSQSHSSTLRQSDQTRSSHPKKSSVEELFHAWDKPTLPFNRQYDRPWLRQQPSPPWYSQLIHTVYGSDDAEEEPAALDEGAQANYPKGFRWFLLLLSGALPYVVAVLDDTIIATIVPVLVNEFHAPAEIGWYASAYFLPLTIFMPLFGKAYSLWAIKWIFFISLSILLVGSIVCATSRTSGAFIAGRIISGTGAAGIINGAMRIIGVSSPRGERTFLEAAGALFMGVCTVSGPILGGVISTHWGWRWAFWINVPVAVGSLTVIFFIFPSDANQAVFRHLSATKKVLRLDPLGSALLIGALACLITVMQFVSTSLTPQLTGTDRALIGLGATFFLCFLVHEAFIRPDLALINRKLVAHRAVWSCCVSLFLLFAGFLNFMFFLSIYYQTVLGEDAQGSAIHLLPYVVAVSVAAFLTAILVSIIRYYNPLFIVGGALFATGAGLVLGFDAATSWAHRIGFEAVMGLGVGFLMLANVTPCQTFLPEKDHSVANGLTFFSSLLGATISLPVSNLLYNKALLSNVMALPDDAKGAALSILSDPTQVVKLKGTIPDATYDRVIRALNGAVHKSFLLGLGFAIASAIFFYTVPWRPLLVMDGDSAASADEGKTEAQTAAVERRDGKDWMY